MRDAEAAIEGAWCRDDRDCQLTISPGACDQPEACHGTRPRSVCVAETCGAVVDMVDDSPCSPNVEANSCGPYRSVFCNGATMQTAPVCREWCESDLDCDDDARCVARECVRPRPGDSERGRTEDGADDETVDAGMEEREREKPTNSEPSEPMTSPPEPAPMKPMSQPDAGTPPPSMPDPEPTPPPVRDCFDQTRCQGNVGEQEDDSACAGEVALKCFGYKDVVCTSERTQSPPWCPTSCVTDAACSGGAECTQVPTFDGTTSRQCLFPCTTHEECEDRNPTWGCSLIAHCVVKGTTP